MSYWCTVPTKVTSSSWTIHCVRACSLSIVHPLTHLCLLFTEHLTKHTPPHTKSQSLCRHAIYGTVLFSASSLNGRCTFNLKWSVDHPMCVLWDLNAHAVPICVCAGCPTCLCSGHTGWALWCPPRLSGWRASACRCRGQTASPPPAADHREEE